MNQTIVVQGPIHERIEEVFSSIKFWFSGRVIFSTWENQNIKKYNGIETLILKDPGRGPIQNINRQIIGLKEALDIVNTDYVFKTRSDIIHSKNIFDLYKEELVQDNVTKIFDKKICISNIMTIDSFCEIPGEGYRFFSPSDWFYLGHTEDIKKIANLFDNINNLNIKNICCEQAIFLSLLQKHSNCFDVIKKDINNINNQFLSDLSLKTNFQIINTISSAKAINLKYRHQPEDLPFYMKENKNENYFS